MDEEEKITFSYTNDDSTKIGNSVGLYNRNNMDWYNKFSRFGYLDPYNNLGTTREYIFFTKPDLHLFDNYDPSVLNPEIANMAFFKDIHERNNNILKQLSLGHKGNVSPFINIFTNSVRSSLDLPAKDALDMDTGATIYGDMINYRWSSNGDGKFDFSLEFEDSKYLEVYLVAKVWDEYERLKAFGAITPPSDYYVTNKILHNQVAAYKFIIDEDGKSIIHYAKVWGVFTKNLPRDVFSNMDKGGPLTISLTFNAIFVEDMDPSILNDFNELVNPFNIGAEEMTIYDSTIGEINRDWAGTPIIHYVPRSDSGTNPFSRYELKWRKAL